MAKQTTYLVGPGGSLVVAGRILTEGAPVPEEALKALGKSGLVEAMASKTIVTDAAPETQVPVPVVPTERELSEAKALELGLGTPEEIAALADADLAALIKDKA